MRTRLIALGAAMALLAGCSAEQPDTVTLPPVEIAVAPAAAAGGACIFWDYAFIEQTIGVRFSVAASDAVGITSTCVVQTDTGPWPYLVLSVVESTKADAALFAELKPAKSKKLKGLGQAAYRLLSKASGDHGPEIEIGWLSEADQLQTLQFTFPAGAKTDEVEQMQAKLLALAKALSTTNG